MIRIVVGVSLLASIACSGGARGAHRGLVLEGLDGRPVHLAQLRRPLVVAFWVTWSGPSRRLLLRLADLHRVYAPQGLAVLAVALDGPETEAGVSAYAQGLELPFRVALDRDSRAVTVFNPRASVPAWVVLGCDGARVMEMNEGYIVGDERRLERAVRRALAACGKGGRSTLLDGARLASDHAGHTCERVLD